MLLSYIVPQTNTFSSLQALIHLQDLNYYFSELALLTIQSETIQKSNDQYNFPIGLYSEIISHIGVYENYLISDFNTWSYCPSSKIINQNVLPIWKSNNPKSLVYGNLVDLAQSTLSNVRSTQAKAFLELASSNQSSTLNYSFYIYFNTLPISVNQFQKAIDDLKACESNRINNLTKTVYYLMIAGFCAVGFSFGVMVCYLIKANKEINLCWNQFLQKVEDNYSILKGVIIDRLAQYHSIYSQDEEETNRRVKKKS
jgi:hypothetical protein